MKTELDDKNYDIVTLVGADGAEIEKFERVKGPLPAVGHVLRVDGAKYEVTAVGEVNRWTVKAVVEPAGAPAPIGAMS